ncbi:MAG: FMN-binding negative transcriptional regulator [Croceibacterium sp.]
MHPNPLFRHEERETLEALIAEVGFGMIFSQTPDGPRVAHVPIISTREGTIRFHLARGNALTKVLAGGTALAVINGPDAYISPRWYGEPGQVPTWNYLALELEGPVRMLDEAELAALLGQIGEANESRIAEGEPWVPEHVAPDYWAKLMRGIVGFELEAHAWRPTFKLSQNKPPDERERIAAALKGAGSPAMGALMRRLAP